MQKRPSKNSGSPAALIDARIAELGDWRGEMLARVRRIIHAAIPGVVEEWKWRGTPVWSSDGIVTTGETYKQVVKLTFARGAALPDPAGLFNSSLEGNTRRAIDLSPGDPLDEKALKALLQAAAELNRAGRTRGGAASAAKAASPGGAAGAAGAARTKPAATRTAPKGGKGGTKAGTKATAPQGGKGGTKAGTKARTKATAPKGGKGGTKARTKATGKARR
jgi:hypothetical protein